MAVVLLAVAIISMTDWSERVALFIVLALLFNINVLLLLLLSFSRAIHTSIITVQTITAAITITAATTTTYTVIARSIIAIESIFQRVHVNISLLVIQSTKNPIAAQDDFWN